MHEYRRFIQQELDARSWERADLMRASGLSRQLLSSILTDKRDHLGQMPDDSTMQKLADGFSIPVERVRTAAARSLVGYTDDGADLTLSLRDMHIDVLLNEIRRRVHAVETAPKSSTSPEGDEDKEARRLADKAKLDAARRRADTTLTAKLKGDGSGDDLKQSN